MTLEESAQMCKKWDAEKSDISKEMQQRIRARQEAELELWKLYFEHQSTQINRNKKE